MKSMKPGEANKRGNIATARIIPLFLLGIIGYSSWTLTDRVCVKYLINPPASLTSHKDVGAATAILVIFYLLLFITLVCLGRLIGTIVVSPGLVPRGEQYWVEKERKRREELDAYSKEDALEHGSTEGYTPRNLRRRQDKEAEGLRAQEFWHKDVFVCGYDGRPPFCSTCYNYKPDRAHHCRELGRCVMKMDHFCPWVGGIVSETSFKFFIQFTGWAALFCLYTMVVMAYYLARRRSEEHGFLNVHWLLTLIFAGLFFIFCAGMCGSSLQFAFLNSTTIENFTRKTKIWYLCFYLTPNTLQRYQNSGRTDLRLITYPRPPEEQFHILQSHGATLSTASEQDIAQEPYNGNTTTPNPPPNVYDPQSTSQSTYPSNPTVSPLHNTISRATSSSATLQQSTDATSPPSTPSQPPAPVEPRTFAILESPPGDNPFDIGPHGNFREIMGHGVFDWLFPLRMSPLVDHRDPVCMYKLGPVARSMIRKAGIAEDGDLQKSRDEREGIGERQKRRGKRGDEQEKRHR